MTPGARARRAAARAAARGAASASGVSSQQILKYQLGPSSGVTLKPMAGPARDGGFAGFTGTF